MSTRVFSRACRALMDAAKSSAAKPAAAPTAGTTTFSKPKSGVQKGILKPVPVSPALSNFLGVSEASRTDAVKKVWEHIKLNNLQNPMNKKEIFCDEKLKTIFNGRDQVGFLDVARLLSQHFVKTP